MSFLKNKSFHILQIEVLLDFPIPHFKSTSRSHYFDLGPTDVIPGNKSLLSQILGVSMVFCIECVNTISIKFYR